MSVERHSADGGAPSRFCGSRPGRSAPGAAPRSDRPEDRGRAASRREGEREDDHGPRTARRFWERRRSSRSRSERQRTGSSVPSTCARRCWTVSRRFAPGLLAAANGGVLYVDEVNLLPDHLVDVLLDVAVSGVNRVEREGVSHSHQSRFVLLGSMNPEEGELRPQLLDRFGLAVHVVAPTDPSVRAEAVRRRLELESDPVGFFEKMGAEEQELRHRLASAATGSPRRRPCRVRVALCAAAGAEGLRADLVCCRASCGTRRIRGRPGGRCGSREEGRAPGAGAPHPSWPVRLAGVRLRRARGCARSSPRATGSGQRADRRRPLMHSRFLRRSPARAGPAERNRVRR